MIMYLPSGNGQFYIIPKSLEPICKVFAFFDQIIDQHNIFYPGFLGGLALYVCVLVGGGWGFPLKSRLIEYQKVLLK